MKKTFAFLGAATAALMMAGAANAQSSGYVGLSYGDSTSSDIGSWNVDGAVAIGSHVQLDAGYSDFDDVDADQWNVGGHFFWRNENHLFGGFVGYTSIDSGGGGDLDEITVAAQGQWYIDQTTLSGNLSYSNADFFGGDVDTIALTGEAKFFTTDNLSFSLNGGVSTIDSSGGGGIDLFSLGGGFEWKPDAMPISLFGNLGTTGDLGNDGFPTSTAWTVGARYVWGGSLRERDRSGAGLSSPSGFLSILL